MIHTTKIGSRTFGHKTKRFYHRFFCTTRDWGQSKLPPFIEVLDSSALCRAARRMCLG
jgi:hypothetical protein